MAEHYITSTDLRGLRALGLQGERVSAAYAQITALLRARLGREHAALFAEPQPGRDDLIDWYAPAEGTVTPLVLLAGDAREAAEERIGTLVADIEGLAATLVDSGRDEEVLLGRMLRLATHLPSADRIYLVGDQPVAVCWGYVEESAADDAPSALYAFIRTVEPSPAPVPPPQPAPAPVAAAAPAPRRGSGWQWMLVLAGLFVAAILAAWLLRDLGREPVAAVIADPVPDPAVVAAAEAATARRDALFEAISRARDLRVWLAGLEHQLAERKAACEPEELIVPALTADDDEDTDGRAEEDVPATEDPDAVDAVPEDPPEQPAEVEDDPDADPAADPDALGAAEAEEELVIPENTEGDQALAFLDGCWQSITDLVNQDEVPLDMRYCFGTDGAGEVRVEEQSGAECVGPVRATISPNQDLIIATDDDVACDNGETYSSWRIECNRGEGGVADCAGAHSEGGEFEVSIRR